MGCHVFLPRESHGQRSLAGCSPSGHTDLDTTEVTLHACIHVRYSRGSDGFWGKVEQIFFLIGHGQNIPRLII